MKTAMQQMLDELMAHEYTIPLELIVKCKELIDVEKEQIMEAYHEAINIEYSLDMQSPREYYEKTYNNGL